MMGSEPPTENKPYQRLALLASSADRAQKAATALGDCCDWVPLEQADAAVVLGGDGFMLETMHRMIDGGLLRPVYGLNLGTVGFLMNRYTEGCRVLQRSARPSRSRYRRSAWRR